MRKTFALYMIIIVFSLTDGGTACASDLFDPCGLLTREEAASLAGEPVGVPEPQESHNPLGQKICLYNTESSSRLIQLSVIRTEGIAAKIRKQGQSVAKIYNATKEMLDPVENVSGIGDDAFWGTPGLHIVKGDAYVLVSVGNTSKRENLELARQISMTVIPRL